MKKCCEMGTHECEVLAIKFGVEDRNRIVPIDRCLVSEICSLWNEGIETLGCCCGHNTEEPTIAVPKKFYFDMQRLGYGEPVKKAIACGIHFYKAKTPIEKKY